LQALFLCGYPVTNIVKNVLTIFVDGGSVLSMQKQDALYHCKKIKEMFMFEAYGFDPIELRRTCFYRKNYELDNDLVRLLLDTKINESEKIGNSHDFLLKPLVHYMHIYLIEYLDEFIKHWFKKDDVKILDWGCGKGQISYLCKKRGMNITACDISYDQKHGDSAFFLYTPIIEKQRIDVIAIDHPVKLPFEENNFDVILSFGVLEHVQNDIESLKEINRVLKTKGLFFCFFLPYKYSWRQHLEHIKGYYYHDHLYTFKKVKELVNIAGLKIVDHWIRDVIPFRSYTPWYRTSERIDNLLCEFTSLKYIASNLEFVAYKN
jgi:SAM-dependent methyltransferase